MQVENLIEELQEKGLEVTFYSEDDDCYSYTIVLNCKTVLRVKDKKRVYLSIVATAEEVLFCNNYLDLCHAYHSYHWPNRPRLFWPNSNIQTKETLEGLACRLNRKKKINKFLTKQYVELREVLDLNLKELSM